MENIHEYKIKDSIWVKLKFLSPCVFPSNNERIKLIDTVIYKNFPPFYIYEAKILGIITNISSVNKGIIITVYCKSYLFCRRNIQNPAFGSLKFYIHQDKIQDLEIIAENAKKLNLKNKFNFFIK